MLLRKLIHYTFCISKTNKLLSNLPFYLLSLNLLSTSLFLSYSLITYNILSFENVEKYQDFFSLKFSIKTKHLFLFTIYILYSKLTKLVNLFHFKFLVIIKKQKKITILRAPCNHKNTKEQYAFNSYTSTLSYKLPLIYNKFYSNYIFSFFFLEKKPSLSFLKNIIKHQHDIESNK